MKLHYVLRYELLDRNGVNCRYRDTLDSFYRYFLALRIIYYETFEKIRSGNVTPSPALSTYLGLSRYHKEKAFTNRSFKACLNIMVLEIQTYI